MSKELFIEKMTWYKNTFGKERTLQAIHTIKYVMWENTQICEWCNEIERMLRYGKL